MTNEASRSEFYEEWRICLREHYLHVVKSGDEITEPTLHSVLLETGFSEDEIADFYDEGLRRREEESPAD
jgi:hypothetical protein